jgi:hypothetical protein
MQAGTSKSWLGSASLQILAKLYLATYVGFIERLLSKFLS